MLQFYNSNPSAVINVNFGQINRPTVGGSLRLPTVEDKAPSVAERLFAHLKGQSVSVLIDGANFHETAKLLDFIIDYASFRDIFTRNSNVRGIHYFTSVSPAQMAQPCVKRNVIHWMKRNGYIVEEKVSKEIIDSETGERFFKGNVDVELTICALTNCIAADHVVLVSGDGDFAAVTRHLQRLGKKVTVVSSNRTQPHRLADELATAADYVVEMADLRSEISRHVETAQFRAYHARNRTRGGNHVQSLRVR